MGFLTPEKKQTMIKTAEAELVLALQGAGIPFDAKNGYFQLDTDVPQYRYEDSNEHVTVRMDVVDSYAVKTPYVIYKMKLDGYRLSSHSNARGHRNLRKPEKVIERYNEIKEALVSKVSSESRDKSEIDTLKAILEKWPDVVKVNLPWSSDDRHARVTFTNGMNAAYRLDGDGKPYASKVIDYGMEDRELAELIRAHHNKD